MIDFDVIATGSKGNAVVLEKTILVDAGVPFKALQRHYRALQLVLLSHSHGDHFKPSTVRKLAAERPSLRFGGCEWMARLLIDSGVDKRNIDVYEPRREYGYGRFAVEPFPLVHDVPNCGYKIAFADGRKLVYATDTNEIKHVEAKGYDLYLLEANYGQDELVERIREKQARGEYCHEYGALNNHLSREKADDWLYSNMGSNSRYVYLHGHREQEEARYGA
ncbi:MBL fold metallo-hydrolase [Eubacteriales bacterium OttesenSCG-928-A19]|nr:MBL fold metallo-hydrolase [Eubacteriales bacterium OttesenSCG-928-A19]